jgi:D-alanyl-D-alanine carboxypeptidase
MISRPSTLGFALAATCAITWTAITLSASPVRAEALILVEADTGKVLAAENATQPWYPASITKIMTSYVTLRAVKEGRITLDKLLTVSHNAAAQSPVKMGFPPGTTVTVDNALKMLMVKSANDIAVVIAEGVGGSVENFADQMNRHAARIGMTQSHFVNPNGLPADEQIVSARDMAILARTVIKEFPEYDYYWHLPGIRYGKNVQRNYNTLIGRYPGADGMKTGFICASGFNLVATASRDGKRMIAVVLGASSSASRALKAAQLLEQGFTSNTLSWLTPSMGTVESLQPINAEPPNLREDMCGGHRKRRASEDEDDSAAIATMSTNAAYSVLLSALRAPATKQNLLVDSQMGEPVKVFTGPANKPDVPKEPKAAAPRKTAAVDPKASKTGAKPATKPSDSADKPATAKADPKSIKTTATTPSPSKTDLTKAGLPKTTTQIVSDKKPAEKTSAKATPPKPASKADTSEKK